MSLLRSVYTVIRGGLIGTAEVMPGVSGGTIALVTGVYETIITSAGHFLSGVKALITDRARARMEFGRVNWKVILTLLAGMVPAVLLGARFLAPLVEDHPIPMLALFMGMTATAIIVPITMKGTGWSAGQVLLGVAVAVGVFFLVGLPPGNLDPVAPLIFVAAAVAVCALVLPGTSGAFILLTLGLYEPTLEALNSRDLTYLGIFVAGLITGLALFVKGLQWLLAHRREVTLVVLTGVVAGALRALWPWQGDGRELLAPGEQVGLAVTVFLLGSALVLGLFLLGRKVDREHTALSRVHPDEEDVGSDPHT
ncbi:DUF368 domain-containing protein [Pseudactinotalea sp. Z1748]|uniref:DUF368 domain-containing protein n=1 Tax=Pseudactinotalea sp. Z1748 TaxID=3413027 RepID=UPI003C7EBDBE